MLKLPFIAAAAALSASLFAIAPASATVAAVGPLPALTHASTSDVQLAASNNYPRKKFKRGSNQRWQHRASRHWKHGTNRRHSNNWRHNNRSWHRHNGWDNGGVAFGFAVGPGYGYGYPGYGYDGGFGYDGGYAYQGGGDEHIQYCMNRYRSYDPSSDTYMGYDGMRHRCNAY